MDERIPAGSSEAEECRFLRVSLGKRVRSRSDFLCFGVRPNWEDYPPSAKKAISAARDVFYASCLYEDLFRVLGKNTYPNNYYAFLGNKIRQSDLFHFLAIPHPRTALFYGANRKEKILAEFDYPFVAKAALRSSMGEGVFLIKTEQELDDYLEKCFPAYIQEYLPIDRDMRVVLIKGRVVHAYWRIARMGEFRNNVSQGGRISFDDIPEEAIQFAKEVAEKCGFDEVGLDICYAGNRYYVLEANMVFGLEGFRQAGVDVVELFRFL